MRRILATAMLAKVMNNNRFILWGIIPLLFFIFSLILLLFYYPAKYEKSGTLGYPCPYRLYRHRGFVE
ncbi:hypothetical protein [Sodalis sp.]|uniref:hypothetical protein n=1 Tax=Sodalis sp. (in: enterobacteria) TaxID=1898979 RepID=UPI0038733BBE